MDYSSQPATFKIKKVMRYFLMYGLSRTHIKVRAQLHLNKAYQTLPAPSGRVRDGQLAGIIGCGNYAFSTLAYYLRKRCGDVIAACMDTDPNRAASLSRYYRIPLYTSDPAEVIEHDRIRLVYIASNHASHAEYAIQALARGKHVYIEKPHVVSEDQLRRLAAAMRESPGRVFLGFVRPGSRFGRIIAESLSRQSGPGLYNWFVAGHAIDPDHWYFKPEEGGRVLGNLCHWTDFVLRLAPPDAYPIRITPARASKSDTDIAVTYTFADDTIAVISFSAKGHLFEGVKERFSAHKGNCLITMDDFRRLTVEVIDSKQRFYNRYRDHGHEQSIVGAFRNVAEGLPYDAPSRRSHAWNTAWLFLKTREALEKDAELTIEPFERSTPEITRHR